MGRGILISTFSTFFACWVIFLTLTILSFSSEARPMTKTALDTLCSKTYYPDLCLQDLSSSSSSNSVSPDLLGNTLDNAVISLALKSALKRVADASTLASKLSAQPGDAFETNIIKDCTELMDDVSNSLNEIISSLSLSLSLNLAHQIRSINVLLSISISLQTACSDGFELLQKQSSRSIQMLGAEDTVSKEIQNCFSLTATLGGLGGRRRRLLSEFDSVTTSMRKLLLLGIGLGEPDSESEPNATVALDGSGDYTTIQAAIDAMPKKYKGGYVIYITAGTYYENVEVPKKMHDLTFLGDGINQTIITSDRNVALQNYTTFRSATVAVTSPGFIAIGITFQNTAGPEGHQAVALRVSSDLSVFHECSFEGYQDTLYALAGRQLYKNCDIYGTVDYIFGNAIALFENCTLYARLPLKGQQNTYTAQGRKVEDDPSGYSFQNCNVTAGDDLAFSSSYSVQTYLGRPWKAYSRTVFIESYLDSLVQPAGWLAWNASNPFEDTLYYGEYQNTGPASDISQRVTWPGVHSQMSDEEASQFSEDNFIAANN